MAKLLTPLNQAALKAEDFSKIERENKEISVSYDRGFFHHVKKALGENKIAAVCLVVLCVIITAALMAPLSSVDPDYMDVMNKMAGPSKEHWFGTDELGRDSFTRALYGSRVSLLVGFATMVVSVTAGTCVGAVSGYAGGKIDIILMRIVDMFQSVPSLLMIIVIFSFVPNNMVTLVLMLALFSWTGVARIVRAQTLTLKETVKELQGEELRPEDGGGVSQGETESSAEPENGEESGAEAESENREPSEPVTGPAEPETTAPPEMSPAAPETTAEPETTAAPETSAPAAETAAPEPSTAAPGTLTPVSPTPEETPAPETAPPRPPETPPATEPHTVGPGILEDVVPAG